ncbi:MAG TPA: GNAT family N-acetyltransferase [Solirubrobacterales bacterium]|nr:GNAT family N-acetyltransferase [Solirubrobacterales bacterium]
MTGRLVAFAELTADELGAWERLAERAVVPNPFFEPGFAAVAARTLDAPEARLLVAEGGDGEWIGCMPVKPLPRLGRGLGLATWNHDYSFLGTPLVNRERLDEYAAALVAAVAEREFGGFLVLRDVDEGPVLTALRRAIDASGEVEVAFERSFERAAVERREQPDYTSTLTSSRRKGLRRRRRKLAAAVEGELRFRDLRCEDDAAGVFLDLEAAGWKGEEGTAMACDPRSAEFFAQMCEWFDQRGRLWMRVMQDDDQTIAMICNVAAGKGLFSFKSTYDESFRALAPGLLLQLDDFEAWHERDQEDYMDSCGEPGAKTLNELWPDRRPITNIVIGRRGLAAKAARLALAVRYADPSRRFVAMLKRRSTRLGVIAGAFLARYQQQALALGESSGFAL